MAEEIKKYGMTLPAEDIDNRLKKIQDGGIGYTEGETIHLIDKKYLPDMSGGGVSIQQIELNLWDFTNQNDTGTYIEVSKTKSDQLTELAKSAIPIFVKIDLGNGPYCYLFNWGSDGEGSEVTHYATSEFIPEIGGVRYVLDGPHSSLGGIWTMNIYMPVPTE